MQNDPINLIDPYGLDAGIISGPAAAYGAMLAGTAATIWWYNNKDQMAEDIRRFSNWLWNENTEDDDECSTPDQNSDEAAKKKPIITGQDALDQLEGIEKAQDDWKKGKRERPIDFIDKSKQRFKNRIKNYKTPQDFYDDFD